MGLCKLVFTWWHHRVSVPLFEHIHLPFLPKYICLLYKYIVNSKKIKYIHGPPNELHQHYFVLVQLK